MRFAVVYVVKKTNYIMREIPEQERESPTVRKIR